MSTRPIPYLYHQTSRALTPSAPSFDPSRKTKSWVAPLPAGALLTDPVTFNIVKDDNSGFATMTMNWQEASTLNLPDFFPPYKQLVATFGQASFPVVSKVDALDICSEVGGDPATLQDAMASVPGVVYPGPDDRAWVFSTSSGPIQASLLLGKKNASGVGAPGHWNGLTWVPEAKVESSAVMPVPIGPVAPGARLVSISVGVYMVEEPDAAAPVVNGGVDTNSAAILAGVNKLLAFFRIA